MAKNSTPKVSVISPVYGVERFIARATETMMRQTLNDVEFIFVDDCTTDNSVGIMWDVVTKFPERADRITVIRHDVNKGLPAARNTGIKAARGKYIFHWDSDDFAEPEMLEALYNAAEEFNADYVWCDWILSFGNGERIMGQPEAATPREALTQILAGEMRYNVWNKLVARSLYTATGIRFPEGHSMGEDMTMIKLLVNARATAHVAEPLYHYIRTNGQAMTQIYSDSHLSELQWNTNDIVAYLADHVSDRAISKEINWFKLNVKLPFLFTGHRTGIRQWRRWYPEANEDIMSNTFQALRTRMVQNAADRHLDITVLLYNRLVNIFYRIIGKN